MTTSVTVTSIKLLFPEFAGQADSAVQFAIDQAQRRVDSSWGNDQYLGWSYLTAHILALAQRAINDGGQQVQSERFGEISITYKTPTPPTAETPFDLLATTVYGAQYLELSRLNFPAVAVI